MSIDWGHTVYNAARDEYTLSGTALAQLLGRIASLEGKLAIQVNDAPPPKWATSWPYREPVEFFGQAVVWVDKDGDEYRIEDMTLDYCANVCRWIRANTGFVFKLSGHERLWSVPLYNAIRQRLFDASNGYDDCERPADRMHAVYPSREG